MRLPEGGAPSYIVINQCVLKQVVTHVESVVPAAQADWPPGRSAPTSDSHRLLVR